MTTLPVDIWLWRLDASSLMSDESHALLSADEQERATAFHFDADRSAFIAAHVGLRKILSRYCATSPRDIAFQNGPAGKPALIGPGPHFNLSHAHGRATLAVCTTADIGVDIEYVRPIEPDIQAIALSPQEAAAMTGLPENEWLARFFRAWTSKEAFVKATGEGLSVDLTAFDIIYDEMGSGRIQRHAGDAADDTNWLFSLFAPFPGYAGAVAARATAERFDLTIHHWGG